MRGDPRQAGKAGFHLEVPLVGGRALPEQSHACRTEGGGLYLWTTPPARTGPLPILSDSLEAYYVVAISENCLWVSGQGVPRTQAAGGGSEA